MAWAEKRSNGRYSGVYRDAAGQKVRVPGTFANKQEAVRQASKKELEERDAPTPQGARNITWGEWESQWQSGRVVASSTARSDKGRLRDHIRPRWGRTLLRDITTDAVQQWVMELTRKGLAPSTVTKCYHLLSASMKAAYNARLVVANPCRGVTLPKPGPMPEHFLDESETDAIKVTLDEFDTLVFELLLGTGMRLGEAMGLHWESVNLRRRVVAVEWAYDPVAQEMKAPKDYERRTIPIGSTLTKLLSEHQKQTGMGKPAPAPVKYPRTARVHTGLVLAHTDGRPFDPSNFRHRFNASVRIAYVGKGKQRHWIGETRIHDLRHTYASRLLENGIPIEEVSRLLGHANITTTMRYAHRARSQWDTVRAALG
ncbi:tyrosine-type recombinase/integrase [Nocardia nova]|uniref:tyrosine-type recombinase/integrase n=1 Tax=Nocardia nova TaxID=37330 RepID=UPI001C4735F0|nr:tyrosine-type recombinase/integrase [Nocardia nova]MBV7702355.1 tyrosine-type recombinase/integrase [Nocardia nova]